MTDHDDSGDDELWDVPTGSGHPPIEGDDPNADPASVPDRAERIEEERTEALTRRETPLR